jgi:diguanylate cyclase (GGDEF)-like protein
MPRTDHLAVHIDIGLVALSIAVAVLASYAALDLTRRSLDASGTRRRTWIVAGGITMGLGIWTMHFVGMLALRMGMPVSYSLLLVASSLLAAIAGSAVALSMVARPHVSRRALLSAAAFMGFAVAAMHYLGMASMEMSAFVDWNLPLVLASVVIAFLASLAALFLLRRIGQSSEGFGFMRRVAAAVLLGFGVAGLHYTAMAASSFHLTTGHSIAQHGLSTDSLVVMLSLGTGVMLAVLIAGAGIDQRRAALAGDIELIARLARELSRIGSARTRICEAIKELAGADAVLLVEFGEAAPTLTASAPVDLPSRSATLARGPHVDAALDSATRAFISDLGRDSPVQIDERRSAASALYEPLPLDGSAVGALVVLWEDRVRELGARTATLVSMLAAEAAVAIDREHLLSKLEYLARRDELTGLLNRRVLGEELEREIAAASHDGRLLSLVMLDLDHFKAYNDANGHQAGDRLLKSAASAWTAALRTADTIARYGGEEFIVLLPDCPPEAAIAAADRLRAGVPDGASCSAGVATLERGESAAELIHHADRALYQAKNSGRDRTCAAQPRALGPVPDALGALLKPRAAL